MVDLSKYRLDSARERLNSAKLLMEAGQYRDSISRSYYAIFTAVRAVLAKDSVDFSKHTGVISYFQREYVKTGIFDKKFSNYLQAAFQIRNNCDYDDFFIASKDDAAEQYERAEEFYNTVSAYLNNPNASLH